MCPVCKSERVGETTKFDSTFIYATECRHDFECFECGCLFEIIYTPINVKIIIDPTASLSPKV